MVRGSLSSRKLDLHHLEEVDLLDEPLVDLVLPGPELGGMRVSSAQVLPTGNGIQQS